MYAYGNGDGFWQSTEEGELFTEAYYDEVYYLKFNDSTEVEMSAISLQDLKILILNFKTFLHLLISNN